MGYEYEMPPEPTREEQKIAIQKLEDDWLKQSNFRWYQTDAQREQKMKIGDKLNETRKIWWRNYCIGLVITGPLFVTPFGRYFRRMSSGVPLSFRPKFVFTAKPEYNQTRNWLAMKKQVPLWLLLSATYAYWFTDLSSLDDEWLEIPNIKRMM